MNPNTDEDQSISSDMQKQTKEATQKDIKVVELFFLRTDDVVITEYSCSIKRKLKMQGTLFILGKHIGFHSKVFGKETKIVELLSDITLIETNSNKKLILHTPKQKHTFHFSDSNIRTDAYKLINTIWRPSTGAPGTTNNNNSTANLPLSPRSPRPTTTIQAGVDNYNQVADKGDESNGVNLSLSDKGWEQIFECAKYTTYKKNQVILTQGEMAKRIYQIGRGTCRVELVDSSNSNNPSVPVSPEPTGNNPTNANGKLLLGKMKRGEIFGEITYLFGGGATVSILADEDNVQIYCIDKTELQELFTLKPDLAAKFYKFLASQIQKRLTPKTRANTPAISTTSNRLPSPTTSPTLSKKQQPYQQHQYPSSTGSPSSPALLSLQQQRRSSLGYSRSNSIVNEHLYVSPSPPSSPSSTSISPSQRRNSVADTNNNGNNSNNNNNNNNSSSNATNTSPSSGPRRTSSQENIEVGGEPEWMRKAKERRRQRVRTMSIDNTNLGGGEPPAYQPN